MPKASNHGKKRAAQKMAEYHFLRTLMPVLYWWLRRRKREWARQVIKRWTFGTLYGRGVPRLSELDFGDVKATALHDHILLDVEALYAPLFVDALSAPMKDLFRPLPEPLLVDFPTDERSWLDALGSVKPPYGLSVLEVGDFIHMDVETILESFPCQSHSKSADPDGSTPSETSSDPHDE